MWQPIELKVPMCCEKCVKKVKDKILEVPGTGLYLSSTLAAKEHHWKMIVRRNIY